MLEWIDEDVLPAAYGGKNTLPMNEWPMEIELARYVDELNAGAETTKRSASNVSNNSNGSASEKNSA